MARTGPLSRTAGRLLLSVTLLVSLVLRPSIGLGQQIKTDGTVGTATTLTGPAYTIPSTLGTLQGTNLFHSFSLFNVPNPGSATFTRIGAPTINNVIARVTGGQQSSIDGLLRLAAAPLADPFAAGTNFFLINPSGVVFGANASLSVTGSFHVSTADYLGFPGNRYSVPSVASELLNLSTAAPTSFGFLSSTPAAITIQGNATAPTLLVPNSASNLARTLSVVGGNIQITGPASATGATILAPRGLVQVVSVASAGEATIGGGPINVSQFTQLGQISMTNKAVIAATANNTATAGGTVLIRAGRLIMNDSSILSNARAPVAGAPRAIDIGPAVDMQLTNNTQIRSETLGAGVAGGEILINASSLSLTGGPQGGSQILRNSQSLGTLPGGGLTINVTGPLTLCAFSDCHAPTPSDPAPGLPPAISNLTQFGENLGPLIISGSSLTMADGANILSRSGTHPSGTTGFAGDINVAVGPLTMLRGANITASASSNIAAPKTTVTADSVFLSGHTALGAPSGIMSTTAPATAVVGDISLDVRNLTVTDGAVVGALPSLGSGSTTSPQGGNVIVKAREPIVISAGGAIVTQSGRADVAQLKITAPAITIDNGFVQTSTVDAGKAGDINVTTDTLNVIGGGQIQSSSVRNAPGAGGNVTINVAGSVSLAGAASGVFSTADVFGTAGRISVTTPSLTLSDGAKMSVTTHGTGAAGDIVATLGKTLSLTNGGQIQSNTTNTNPAVGGAGGNVTITANESVTLAGAASGIFSTTNNIGNAGRITATTPSLTMSDGAKISVSTQGGGTAGDIALNLSSLALTGGARIDSDTAGGGHGGNVTIAAPASVNISGATVSSNATASGAGGNIKIDTAQMQLMSQATLSATSSGTGNAGKISVTTPSLAMSDGSKISVNTQGAGAAGDITLDLNTLTLAGGARIDSGTQAGGRGGTVTIDAGQSVSLAGAASGVFSTAESTGNAGTITVTSPTLTLGDGAKMSVTTQGGGAAGDIVATLGKTLSLTNGGQIQSNTTNTNPAVGGAGGNVTITANESVTLAGVASGVFSTTDNAGNAGRITATTPSLTMSDGAKISVSTQGGGTAGDIALNLSSLALTGGARIDSDTAGGGHGGNVTIAAPASVNISGATVSSNATASGEGGNIKIDTAQMQLMSQATLSATSSGTGNAGKITVTTPSLAMSDGSKISVNTQGAGAAGDITLDLNTLTLAGGARIDSGTQAGGHGGTVTINAGQSVSLAGAAGGVFSTAESTGNAGTITVTSPTLTLGDGAKMSVTTQGGGAAGDIALNLGSLALAGGSRIDSGTSGAGHGGHITISAPSSVSVLGSGVSSNATAGGAGGNVSINTPQMALTDHATLSATSTGTGNAGNIAVVIGNSLRMRDSAITTSATTADGGNISITTTGSQLYLLNGKITTSVQSGFGQGGNIIIGSNAHPIEFVILSGSEIRADAFGGPGGNIDIFAGTFLTSSSILSASSALGVPGTIGIQAGVTDVSSSVSQLPESVLQAATLLRAACATRLAGGGSSSLVVSAREGLPAEPGGVLPSPLLAEGPADSTRSQDEGPGHDDLSNRIALWVPAPRCLR